MHYILYIDNPFKLGMFFDCMKTMANNAAGVSSFDRLEDRVFLSSTSVPATTFYVPDADVGHPADLVSISGGIPLRSDFTQIQNGETARVAMISVPDGGSLKILNKGDGVSDGNFDVLGTNIKSISLGKVSGNIEVLVDGNIGTFSATRSSIGSSNSRFDIRCGSAGTIAVVGDYYGGIDALKGSITKLSIGNSFIGDLNVAGNLGSFYAEHVGRNLANEATTNINVGGNIGTMKLGAALKTNVVYPVGEDIAMDETIIKAANIKSITTARNVVDSSVIVDSSLGTVSVLDLKNSAVTIGGDYAGNLTGLTARNISDSKIQVGVFDDGTGLFGIDYSKIGTVTAKGTMNNSEVYGVNSDPFTFTLAGKKTIINKTTSSSENGNDLRTVPPIYSIQQIKSGTTAETRFFYKGGQHFMSVLNNGGIFAIRPHPGTDVNGWGTTFYAMPFLPGATLKGSVIDLIGVGREGIDVSVHGKVSSGLNSSYGMWKSSYKFDYNPLEKKVSGEGIYDITLSKVLSGVSGDLNLYKIASNHLENVPLLSGGYGSTGDMLIALTEMDDGASNWTPETQPAYFPGERTENMTVRLPPTYNEVDTAKQGYSPIAAAYKPGMGITLNSRNPGANMIFGGIYNMDQAQQFWSDNIGITPLVLKDNPLKVYSFDVIFDSQADPAG